VGTPSLNEVLLAMMLTNSKTEPSNKIFSTDNVMSKMGCLVFRARQPEIELGQLQDKK
jgi:hypothetical protein